MFVCDIVVPGWFGVNGSIWNFGRRKDWIYLAP